MKKILLIIVIAFCIFQMVVLATAIDIGASATDRETTQSAQTLINKTNPANETGTITSVEIWANAGLSNCEVATFFVVSGNFLSTRDSQSIGTVAAGSKQTFEVNLNVQAGDYIGMYYTAGLIERDSYGFGGMWTNYGGDNIPCTNVEFSLLAGDAISLYGTGTTKEEEDNAIFFGTNF